MAQKGSGTHRRAKIHRALDPVADERALIRALQSLVLKGAGHIEDVDATAGRRLRSRSRSRSRAERSLPLGAQN
jgi:hypothetical protein